MIRLFDQLVTLRIRYNVNNRLAPSNWRWSEIVEAEEVELISHSDSKRVTPKAAMHRLDEDYCSISVKHSKSLHETSATIVESAGTDGAVVVFIDTTYSPDASDKGPGVRVLLNDHEIYVGKEYHDESE